MNILQSLSYLDYFLYSFAVSYYKIYADFNIYITVYIRIMMLWAIENTSGLPLVFHRFLWLLLHQ